MLRSEFIPFLFESVRVDLVLMCLMCCSCMPKQIVDRILGR